MEFRRRGSGAHDLADVAAGLNDAYVELHINARDALASIPLVREAGGLTNDFLEGDGLTRGDFLLAVTPELPDRLVELTREASSLNLMGQPLPQSKTLGLARRAAAVLVRLCRREES
jgi:hypothetical protein